MLKVKLIQEGSMGKKCIIPNLTPALFFVLVSAGFMQKGEEVSSGYLGVDICKCYHKDKYESYAKSLHANRLQGSTGTPVGIYGFLEKS